MIMNGPFINVNYNWSQNDELRLYIQLGGRIVNIVLLVSGILLTIESYPSTIKTIILNNTNTIYDSDGVISY